MPPYITDSESETAPPINGTPFETVNLAALMPTLSDGTVIKLCIARSATNTVIIRPSIHITVFFTACASVSSFSSPHTLPASDIPSMLIDTGISIFDASCI